GADAARLWERAGGGGERVVTAAEGIVRPGVHTRDDGTAGEDAFDRDGRDGGGALIGLVAIDRKIAAEHRAGKNQRVGHFLAHGDGPDGTAGDELGVGQRAGDVYHA